MACDCKTLTQTKNINIARGFLGSLAGLLFLLALIVLGANMDYANFPGSNLVFATGTGDQEGEMLKMPNGDGWRIDGSSEDCKNFATLTQTDKGADPAVCESVSDDTSQRLEFLDSDGNRAADGTTGHGWLIAPPCVKTNKLSDCAPFGADSAVSGLGQAFFGVLAINAALFGAHTALELGLPSGVYSKESLLFGLNIVWAILSFSLFVWAAVGWRGMCDKIDTGLGRQSGGVQGCATTYCTISYGGFFASYAVALVVYRIPSLLTFFGIGGLESAYDDDL